MWGAGLTHLGRGEAPRADPRGAGVPRTLAPAPPGSHRERELGTWQIPRSNSAGGCAASAGSRGSAATRLPRARPQARRVWALSDFGCRGEREPALTWLGSRRLAVRTRPARSAAAGRVRCRALERHLAAETGMARPCSQPPAA